MALGSHNVSGLAERHCRAGGVDGSRSVRLGAHQAIGRDERRLDLLANVSGKILQIIGDTYGLGLLVVVDEHDLGIEASRRAKVESRLEVGRLLLGRIHPRPVAIVVAGTDKSSSTGSSETFPSRADEAWLGAHGVRENVVRVDPIRHIGRRAVREEDLDLARQNRAGAAERRACWAGHEGLGITLAHHAAAHPSAATVAVSAVCCYGLDRALAIDHNPGCATNVPCPHWHFLSNYMCQLESIFAAHSCGTLATRERAGGSFAAPRVCRPRQRRRIEWWTASFQRV
jgi:hypothetical protein